MAGVLSICFGSYGRTVYILVNVEDSGFCPSNDLGLSRWPGSSDS